MKLSTLIRSTLLPLLILPQAAAAQSDWTATMFDGTRHEEVYRLNGSLDTLVSASDGGRWQQFAVSRVSEIRVERSDAWWYIPLATLGIGLGVVLGQLAESGGTGSSQDGNSILLTLGATSVGVWTAAILAKDEVHDLESMSQEQARNVVAARLPIAFGSREEGITRFDLSSPTGRRISPSSWWGKTGGGPVGWSDGYISIPSELGVTWWDREHVYMLNAFFVDNDDMKRSRVALLYGRGITLNRGYGIFSAGAGYEVSSFDPLEASSEPPYETYSTPVLAFKAEMIWPLGSWFGLGLGATGGLSLKGVHGGMSLSIMAGDLE